MRTIVWFRNDLRLHDHEALSLAAAQGAVLPVFVVEPRYAEPTRVGGFPRLRGPRAHFLCEALADLRESLERVGSTLVFRVGQPEVVLADLAREWQAHEVVCHEAPGTEEAAAEARVARALQGIGCGFRAIWGGTLYHPSDLPFDLDHLPELFTQFRLAVERSALVRLPLPTPVRLDTPNAPDAGTLPTPAALGATDIDIRSPWAGGETAGLRHLDQYIWQGDHLRRYKETRNGMLVSTDSTKLSPWMALGCLSPRQVWAEVQRYEQQRIKNDSTYWLVFELLWRDYFRFIAQKHGARIFRPEGLQNIAFPWQEDEQLWSAWTDGQTGYPLVDAAMLELRSTGYTSNRARQNVASFLTKNLALDWRLGAEWFESWLVDHDVASNWGNWLYAAGVGNDNRGFRFFHITKQSEQYDPEGAYVKHWLPALRDVPPHLVHQPWRLSQGDQQRYQLLLGKDYPRPIVDLIASARENEQRYHEAKADPKWRKGNFKLQAFVRRNESRRRSVS